VLTYPEIRGVLAEMEQEFMDAAKNTPAQKSFSNKARYVLAMVDRRLANKIKNKHDKGKDSKFFF
tara:strand:+ start:1097 stop:1291 length:195 start_codon:yes stop_codon:yes gene_type:complete